MGALESIRIVHRDSRLAVVGKPAGMLVHRGMGASREEPFLLQEARDLLGAWLYPVHRLDRPTSGLVVFAFDPGTARFLQEAWQDGRVRKTYRAIARGWMPEPQGLRDEALDNPDNGVLQEARTRWRELARLELPWPCGPHPGLRLAHLELEPLTGRWHQLRRHLSRLHHPIAGDTTHGCRHVNHLLRDRLGWWGLHLSAIRLVLPHPEGGEDLDLRDDPVHGTGPAWERLLAEAARA